MDEKDYQIATLKKEKAEALAGSKKKEKANDDDLTVGGDAKDVDDDLLEKRSRVDRYAFGQNK